MVDVISSGKVTKLHTFPDLVTKCDYSHIANEAADFHILPGRNCFLQINKKFGFELLRTINKNGIEGIQRLKKRQLDDTYCVNIYYLFKYWLYQTLIFSKLIKILLQSKCSFFHFLCQQGAISKTFGGELALGLSTGIIRRFSVQAGDFIPNKLKPDRFGNSVIGLDYTSCDEHLAALYESGDINLFGLKTGVKTDVFRCEGT